MRLLNKTTLELEWFTDSLEPPYIILSHRWKGEETSFQEFTARNCEDESSWSDGTAKAVKLCRESHDRPENYVWIDTCCIDKISSTELQEAINSMYKWYQQAALCVVLLDDVDIYLDDKALRAAFIQSLWFTRGWMLQELIAPSLLLFVDKHWIMMGFRDVWEDLITKTTGIPQSCLGTPANIQATPIAERMSWMSDRKTTRVEDLAYCMLGIFDVNMTMLYGEGSKAFFRLQKELIDSIDDESIFLWSPNGGNIIVNSSILAPNPQCFRACRRVTVRRHVFFHRSPLRFTAKGLELEVYDDPNAQVAATLRVPLNCKIGGKRACITISNLSNGSHLYWKRIRRDQLETVQQGSYKAPPRPFSETQVQLSLTAKNSIRPRGPEEGSVAFKVFVK